MAGAGTKARAEEGTKAKAEAGAGPEAEGGIGAGIGPGIGAGRGAGTEVEAGIREKSLTHLQILQYSRELGRANAIDELGELLICLDLVEEGGQHLILWQHLQHTVHQALQAIQLLFALCCSGRQRAEFCKARERRRKGNI